MDNTPMYTDLSNMALPSSTPFRPAATSSSQQFMNSYQQPYTPRPVYPQGEFTRMLQSQPISTSPGFHQPQCKLNCKCCASFLMTGTFEECACNSYKTSVATQTDSVLLQFNKEDYFDTKTSAYKVFQAQLSRVLTTNNLHSTSDRAFEDAVSSVIEYISDLSNTPTTRSQVRKRLKKKMYNSRSYEVARKLAAEHGMKAKECQSSQVKRTLTYGGEPSNGTTIVETPDRSNDRTQEPARISPASSRSSQSPASNASTGFSRNRKTYHSVTGVSFCVGDIVCIARSKTSCDYAKVTKVWNTKVDITYLKKNNNSLVTWTLSSDKLYTDNVHINSIFFNLGQDNQELTSTTVQQIKNSLKTLF